MNVIKWWKSKFAWMIIILVLIAMVLSFLSAYFLPNPWGLILVFLICLPVGITIRILVKKKIDRFIDDF